MRLVFVMVLAWVSAPALAAIPALYHQIARETHVPASVLYGVALQESRAALGKHVARPWPWTLNVRGTGYRYGSRAAVFSALNAWLRAGETRIDVGLMQIHWRYHAPKLGNSWRALSPEHNLRVGADVLRACFRQLGNWADATGCYHSQTPWRADAYKASVAALIARNVP